MHGLGDLYGAIGSPVRMTRTVVVGKRKDLVQRILYVLTYFLRCSELQENRVTWSGQVAKGEQALNGSNITTALEKGEAEESDYVVVTVRNEPALIPPVLPRKHGGPALVGHGSYFEPTSLKGKRPGKNAEQCIETSSRLPRVGSPKRVLEDFKQGRNASKSELVPGGQAQLENFTLGMNNGNSYSRTEELLCTSAAVKCPERTDQRYPSLQKVTFQIGSSASPESDLESQRKEVDKTLRTLREKSRFPRMMSSPVHIIAQSQQEKTEFCFKPRTRQKANPIRVPSAPCLSSGQLSVPFDSRIVTRNSGEVEEAKSTRSQLLERSSFDCDLEKPTDEQRCSPTVTENIPCGDAGRKHPFRLEENIPRNESSDSALGESDDEGSTYIPVELSLSSMSNRPEELSEVELALPR